MKTTTVAELKQKVTAIEQEVEVIKESLSFKD